jgi:hypothetical protein
MPAAGLRRRDCLVLLCGHLRRFNQLPELRAFLERLVLARFQSRSEQEILERVPVKIDAVISHAKAVQDAPALLQFAEHIQFRAEHLLRQAAKIAEDLQLQFLGHPPELGGRDWREDNLKGLHRG